MSKRLIFCLTVVACMAWSLAAFAHTPILSCYLNGDGTVTCEGGFSDGSSASGTAMTVRDASGNVLQQGKMDDLGEFSFTKPEGDFEVEFNAGPGHVVVVKGQDIQ